MISQRVDDSEGSGDVVVTARRVEGRFAAKAAPRPREPRARPSSQRGDWNACTVNDPARNPDACGAGPLTAGLTRAWRGDLDGAIAEFSTAIAGSRQPGLAYLNRGLSHARKGDRDMALADLDRAVRLSPGSARALYNRSLLLRRAGERARADSDAAEALALDPRYAEVVR